MLLIKFCAAYDDCTEKVPVAALNHTETPYTFTTIKFGIVATVRHLVYYLLPSSVWVLLPYSTTSQTMCSPCAANWTSVPLRRRVKYLFVHEKLLVTKMQWNLALSSPIYSKFRSQLFYGNSTASGGVCHLLNPRLGDIHETPRTPNRRALRAIFRNIRAFKDHFSFISPKSGLNGRPNHI